MTTLRCGAAAAAALATLSPALADTETVTVTGTRLGTPIDRTTTALSVLEADDLARRQTVFLIDALGTLPGVSFDRSGGFGGLANIRLRGAAAGQTLVLIDGVPVNDPTAPSGEFNAAFLDVNDIARVEVLRGPHSTLWGSDAIGGVVLIETVRPGEGLAGRLSAEGGSFETQRVAGSLAFGAERFDARAGAVWFDTGGLSKADEDDGNREDDPFQYLSIDGRVGFDITRDIRIEAFGRFAEARNDFDSFGVVTGVTDGNEREEVDERQGGLHATAAFFDGRFEADAFLATSEIARRYLTDGIPSFAVEGGRDITRLQGTLRPGDGVIAAFGAERERTTFEGQGATRIDALFLLAEIAPAEGFVLSGGIRHDEHSTFGGATTGRLGARWTIDETLAIRASLGQGFKAPTVFQLNFFFPPATGPNRDLQPEEADGFDAAVLLTLLEGRLSAEIGYFAIETDNLIGFANGTYFNVSEAETEGVEIAARLALAPDLALSASYTYTDAVNAATGAPLLRIPEHSGFLALDWQATEALGLTAMLRVNGEEAEIVSPANPNGTNAAWTRADVALRYRLTPAIELFGRVENLTDEDYQDVFGFGTPGLSVYGGIRLWRG